MSAIITCHRTGVTFDYDSVHNTPFKYVPGTKTPLDMAGVDFHFPAPLANDSRFAEKTAARAEAVGDAETYAAAAAAARK